MTVQTDAELFDDVRRGDDSAFERIYDRYQARVRVMAWKVSHRPDWVDDILNESWCRAFNARASYNSAHPFLVWMGGILTNVYREHCRKSPRLLIDADGSRSETAADQPSPEKVAAEAELLAGLDDCVSRLDPLEQRIVELRFFRGLSLRAVAKEVTIAESTLRDLRLPAILESLRGCLTRKGIDPEQVFSAQTTEVVQYLAEDRE